MTAYLLLRRRDAAYHHDVLCKQGKEKKATLKKAKSLADTLLFLPPASKPTHHPNWTSHLVRYWKLIIILALNTAKV